jgi:ankyrin repeat protein
MNSLALVHGFKIIKIMYKSRWIVICQTLLMMSCGKTCQGDPFEWVSKGNLKCLEKFLKSGGDPNLSAPHAGSLMIYALDNNSLRSREVVKLLLDHGANPDIAPPGFNPPLVLAASWADEKSVQMLLERGANKSVRGVDGKLAIQNIGEAGPATDRVRKMLEK